MWKLFTVSCLLFFLSLSIFAVQKVFAATYQLSGVIKDSSGNTISNVVVEAYSVSTNTLVATAILPIS